MGRYFLSLYFMAIIKKVTIRKHLKDFFFFFAFLSLHLYSEPAGIIPVNT